MLRLLFLDDDLVSQNPTDKVYIPSRNSEATPTGSTSNPKSMALTPKTSTSVLTDFLEKKKGLCV